jgi:hypothetical protein
MHLMELSSNPSQQQRSTGRGRALGQYAVFSSSSGNGIILKVLK